MKTAFFHDTKFIKDTHGNLYTGGSFSEEIWKRYTDVFEEFTVVARCKNSNQENLKDKYNPFIISNKKFVPIKQFRGIKNILKNKRDINRTIKKVVLESDFIIARLPSIIGNISISYAKKYNKPYLLEIVGCAWDSLWNYNIKGKLIAPYMYYKTKRIVRNAPHITYITKGFLQKRYPSDNMQDVCPNVALKVFDYKVLNDKKKKMNLEKRKIIIGTLAATDVKYKGQEYVIKAISYLKDIGCNYKLEYQIAGGGNQDRLKKICKKYGAEEQVKFLGSIPHEDVFDYLDNIDIYIQPSNAEAQGRSLIEAMSRGCACICSKVGGMPELLDKKYIFNKKDYKQLALIIKDVITNIETVSKDSFERSKEFDIEKISQKRKEIFERIKEEYLNE